MATKTVKTLKPPKADIKKTKKIRKPMKITSRQQAQKKKKKKPKIASDKLALKKLAKYEKNVASGKEKKSSYMEQFKQDIAKYYTKKGTVKKRLKTEDIIKYNRMIREFNKSPYSKESQRKQIRKKIKSSTMGAGLYTPQEAENIIDNFSEDSIHYLMGKGYVSSTQVQNISADFLDLDNKTGLIKTIAEELMNKIKFDTPEELQDDLFEEGALGQKIDDFLNLIQNTNELEDYFRDIVIEELKLKNKNKSDKELEDEYEDYISEEVAYRVDNYEDHIKDLINRFFFED